MRRSQRRHLHSVEKIQHLHTQDQWRTPPHLLCERDTMRRFWQFKELQEQNIFPNRMAARRAVQRGDIEPPVELSPSRTRNGRAIGSILTCCWLSRHSCRASGRRHNSTRLLSQLHPSRVEIVQLPDCDPSHLCLWPCISAWQRSSDYHREFLTVRSKTFQRAQRSR